MARGSVVSVRDERPAGSGCVGGRRRWRSIAAVLVGAAVAGSAPHGGDGAEAVDPAQAVGRLLRGERGHCSAVLVAPDRALTAGHCVSRGKEWRPAATGGLVLRLDRADHRVRRVRLAATSPFDARGGIGDPGSDWAVLELARPVEPPPVPLAFAGDAAALPAFVTGHAVTKIGWARVGEARYERRTTEGCALVGRAPSGRAVLFRCGSGLGGGASGSVLVAETAAGPVVIGMQSGRTTAKDGTLLGVAAVPPREMPDAAR